MQLFQQKKPTPLFSVIAFSAALTVAGMAGPAFAGAPPPGQASHIGEDIYDTVDGWTYEYTVYNDGWPGWTWDGEQERSVDPAIRDWELPWFGDAGITNIVSPNGWDYEIETIGVANATTGWDGEAAWQNPGDPWYQGPDSPFTSVDQVLHWYTNEEEFFILTGWFEGEGCPEGDEGANWDCSSLGGFGFDADFAPIAAPYQASWAELPIQTGDPGFPGGGTPSSPLATGSSIPEPGTLALLAGGLLGWSVASRKRKDKKSK